MNNINNTNHSISFNGLIIKGNVSGKNISKLGEFASRIENINFIKDIEKNYGIDAVLDNEICKMSFSHPKYGNLSEKYGCGFYQLQNVFRDISYIIRNIKASLVSAEKDC